MTEKDKVLVPPPDDINPIDVVEALAAERDWNYERSEDNELTIVVNGKWTDYHVSYTWMANLEALHLSCIFDLKIPEPRRADTQALIALINERLWIGHFDLWLEEGLIMFRHALVLAGGIETSGKQCESLIGSALDTCELYFTAFQFVVWAGKKPKEAMQASAFETEGNA